MLEEISWFWLAKKECSFHVTPVQILNTTANYNKDIQKLVRRIVKRLQTVILCIIIQLHFAEYK